MLDYVSREPFLVARIEPHKEATVIDADIEARGLTLRERALEALQHLPQAPAELANAIRSIESVPALADIVASFMDLKAADKQEILATFDLKARLDRVLDAAQPPHRGAEGFARKSTSAPARPSMNGRRRRCCASACVKFKRSSAKPAAPARKSRN